MTPKLPRRPFDAAPAITRQVVLRSIALLSAPLFLAYPILVYYAMQHYSARAASAVLLVGLSPLVVRALRVRRRSATPSSGTPGRPIRWQWLWPVLAAGLIVGAMIANSVRSLLLVPVCINGALLLTFGLTLFEERPLIERFARLQHGDLSPEERHWCRMWTVIWSAFFAFNMVVAGLFTLVEWVDWWTFYNGLIAYVVMGCLFAIEYVVRKVRFQRFDDHAFDRALRWCFVRMGWVP